MQVQGSGDVRHAPSRAQAGGQDRHQAGQQGGRARGRGGGDLAEADGAALLLRRIGPGQTAQRDHAWAASEGGVALAQAVAAAQAMDEQQQRVRHGIAMLAGVSGLAVGGAAEHRPPQAGHFAGQPAAQTARETGLRRAARLCSAPHQSVGQGVPAGARVGRRRLQHWQADTQHPVPRCCLLPPARARRPIVFGQHCPHPRPLSRWNGGGEY